MAEGSPEINTEWWDNHGPEAMLARRLRQLRLARGMSQQDVADHMRDLGHSWYQTTVAKIEKGGRPIRLNEAALLAALFDIPPQELLAVAPPEPEDRANDTMELRAHVERLALLVQTARRVHEQCEADVHDTISRAHQAQQHLEQLEADLRHVRAALDQAERGRWNSRTHEADLVLTTMTDAGPVVTHVIQAKRPNGNIKPKRSNPTVEAFVTETDFDEIMPSDWSAEGYDLPTLDPPRQRSEDSSSTAAG